MSECDREQKEFEFTDEQRLILKENIPDNCFERLCGELRSVVSFYIFMRDNSLEGENKEFNNKDFKGQLISLQNGLKKSLSVLKYIKNQSPVKASGLNYYYGENPYALDTLEKLNKAVHDWSDAFEEESSSAKKAPLFITSRTLYFWENATKEIVEIEKVRYAWSNNSKPYPFYEILKLIHICCGFQTTDFTKQLIKCKR